MLTIFLLVVSVFIVFVVRTVINSLFLMLSDVLPEKFYRNYIYFPFSNGSATLIGFFAAYYFMRVTNCPIFYIFFFILGGWFIIADWHRISHSKKQSSTTIHHFEIYNTIGDLSGIITFIILMFWLGAFTL